MRTSKWITSIGPRHAAGVVLLLSAFGAICQTIDRPVIIPGDAWTYRDTKEVPPTGWTQTRDDVVVSRVTGSSIYFLTKETGSSQTGRERFSTRDWALVRDVNGTEMVTNQPLAFPLAAGKTWELEFTEQRPTKLFNWQKSMRKYTAIGFEQVQVPAGKFNALKIEVEGRWIAELSPAQTTVQATLSTGTSVAATTQANTTTQQTSSGRFYSAYWYVPEVKRFVKNVEETYDNKGMLAERVTGELESFKVAK